LSLEDAIDKIEACRSHYNEQRPHSSLGYQTPAGYLSGALPPTPRGLSVIALGLRKGAAPGGPGPAETGHETWMGLAGLCG